MTNSQMTSYRTESSESQSPERDSQSPAGVLSDSLDAPMVRCSEVQPASKWESLIDHPDRTKHFKSNASSGVSSPNVETLIEDVIRSWYPSQMVESDQSLLAFLSSRIYSQSSFPQTGRDSHRTPSPVAVQHRRRPTSTSGPQVPSLNLTKPMKYIQLKWIESRLPKIEQSSSVTQSDATTVALRASDIDSRPGSSPHKLFLPADLGNSSASLFLSRDSQFVLCPKESSSTAHSSTTGGLDAHLEGYFRELEEGGYSRSSERRGNHLR